MIPSFVVPLNNSVSSHHFKQGVEEKTTRTTQSPVIERNNRAWETTQNPGATELTQIHFEQGVIPEKIHHISLDLLNPPKWLWHVKKTHRQCQNSTLYAAMDCRLPLASGSN